MSTATNLLNNPDNLRDAIAYTAAKTNIASPLLEKDLWALKSKKRPIYQAIFMDKLSIKGTV